LIKIRVTAEQRQNVLSLVNIFRANVVDVSEDGMIVELTGNQSKIEALVNLLESYEILEIARTGIAGLSRGTKDVVTLPSK
jgi:acetolactate synthase-1/3 small subunit